MAQVWGDDGKVTPVTAVSIGPNIVTQIKTEEKDGYSAVQVGWGERNPKNINKPLKGHIKELGNFMGLKEFRLEGSLSLAVGDKIDASVFKPGDSVVISAISKGKGFQGGVKRHGFHGGSRTHGQKHSEREPGGIGGGGRAGGRVAKGMRMAGRMGGDRVTIKGVKIIQVNAVKNLILVGGAVPGRRGSLVEIRSTKLN
ncbi:MAG: 50S ribosomal protein L3 [Parcubacteria group bacterium GW2011_GWA2_44_15]|nr:MAG: 50S ribosomal protein L3 [Parcubacteria group bacterium GW2011_GWA2_44_15]